MAFVIADRVRETSVSTGTGNFTLDGAVTGYQTFDAVLDSADTTYYTIAAQGGSEWEVGIGTFTAPATLARTTILSSSNGGSIVTFSAGSKDVFISLPASKTVQSFSAGSTGLTPSTASFGAVTLGGTLAVANGGTGSTTASAALTALGAVDKAGDTMTGNLTVPSLNSGPLAGFRNALINGAFNIAQRGTSFVAGANNDDTYNLDRWYVLSDGNDVVDITQSTTEVPANGSQTSIALDVETTAKKFGIAQIIEQRNCQGLIGNTVTLSFKAKVSSTTKLDNVKCAIVSWSGTADTVTSDIISAWNVEGTNPTLIANATYENTPANLNVTTSWATYSVSAAVDTASTGNIIVFIWSDVTDTTAGDFLYITDVQIEIGSVSTPFERRSIGTELLLCQRYYCETRASARFPAFGASQIMENEILWPVNMRAAPTITVTSGGIRSNNLSGYPQTQNSTIYGARYLLASNGSGDCYAVNDTITAAIEL